MGTVNGKLINQELNYFDELAQKTDRINQRCEYLESQFTAISRQDYTQYLQTISQEVDNSKSYLHKLEQKIGFLEDTTSKQAKELSFIKITSVIGLIALWFIFSTNNQPESPKKRPQKKAEFIELIQQVSHQTAFVQLGFSHRIKEYRKRYANLV